MARYKYRYETHVHTCSVSKCGRSTVEEQVRFYADLGYDGMFITEHFMRGNCTIPRDLPWEEQVDLYCASYEKGAEIGKQYGIKVFFGLEVSFGGCDLIVLGLGKEWLKAHPEVMTVSQEDFCVLVRQSGGFIVHAHPFREAAYIMMSSVIPDKEDAVEIYNPKVVQATMGALARVKVHYCSLPQLIESLTDIPVYGTFLNGNIIYTESLSAHGLIVMGNEGKGVSLEVEKLINNKLYIPNYPQERETSESLNVAIATAVVCSEFRRRLLP